MCFSWRLVPQPPGFRIRSTPRVSHSLNPGYVIAGSAIADDVLHSRRHGCRRYHRGNAPTRARPTICQEIDMHIRFAPAGESGRPPVLQSRTLSCAVLLIGALALPSAVAAQGKDDLYEVTSKMEMPGMPMAMPAQTSRVCVAKSGKDDDYVPRRENCRVLESKRTGNKLTYKMACTGKDAMTVDGEMTFGSNSYEGRMKMSGKMEGQPMEMMQTYSGKRVGDCTAPAK